jgi:hypothetical protein
MAFPLGQDEWWLCDKQNCAEDDRASPLESQVWIHFWLQDLRTDFRKMSLLRDLVRSNISALPFNLAHQALRRRIEEMFLSGQLHVHIQRREVHSGSGADEPDAAVSAANPSRIASDPAPIVDQPVFAPNLKMAAQAAGLVAAAVNGIPFCQECTKK